MSKFELNPMFLRMNQSLGNIVIYERNGKMYTRVKGKRTAAPSPAQIEVNETFSRLSSDWTSAGTLMNSSWYRYGEKKKINGYNLYMKTNFKNEREGKAIELIKPLGEITSPVVSSAPRESGEIICTYTIPPEESGRFIHFFVKKRIEGISSGVIKRHSPENTFSNSYIIRNLEPGSEYIIYSALTDKAYKDSTEFSASVFLESSAGI